MNLSAAALALARLSDILQQLSVSGGRDGRLDKKFIASEDSAATAKDKLLQQSSRTCPKQQSIVQ
jgi:hypothetical protein